MPNEIGLNENDNQTANITAASVGIMVCARNEAAAAILADLANAGRDPDIMSQIQNQSNPPNPFSTERSIRLTAHPLSYQYQQQIRDFRTSNKAISHFIKTEAFSNEQTGQTRTTLYFDQVNNQLMAFSSIRCSALRVETSGRISIYPAIEIVILCVDDRYIRKGIGEAVLSYVLRSVNKMRESVGIQLVTLFSVKDAVNFYKRKFNFHELSQGMQVLYAPSYGTCVPMYLVLPANIIT